MRAVFILWALVAALTVGLFYAAEAKTAPKREACAAAGGVFIEQQGLCIARAAVQAINKTIEGVYS